MPRRRRRKPLPSNATVTVESISHDGRGVTHVDGKTVFIDGALPGEVLEIAYTASRKKHDEARVATVLEPSKQRVEPACAHFGLCGGCSLQHLEASAQIEHKEKSLLDGLKHVGKTEPATLLPRLVADSSWGYRRKARLGVKYVHKKEKVLVGFREKRNSFLAELEQCEVVHPKVGHNFSGLAAMIRGLSVFDAIAQIEVAVLDEVTALIFRNLRDLSDQDKQALIAFGEEHDYQIYLQSGGPDTVSLLSPNERPLEYFHTDYDVRISMRPLDFFQVNFPINRLMVKQAIELLAIEGHHRVLDLFCGLGNFTLPIARSGATVVGVEGDHSMVEMAKGNAKNNDLNNADFYVADLFEPKQLGPWFKQDFDRVLLDPPRSGAREIIELIGGRKIERIVYVSCHPGTLARDADILVNQFGYRLEAAGVMDMFPHTTHVESMALFVKS